MPDCLEARERPLRISRTAPHFSPTPDLDPHPSASPAGGDFFNHHITGPVADRAHVTVSHSTFSTRSVLSGVSAFLRPIMTGPCRNVHQSISKVFQPSAEDPVPVRTRDGVQRRNEAKCASRSAGETSVASNPSDGPEQQASAIPTQATRPPNPRPRSPARRRSVSVAPTAAAKPSRSSSDSSTELGGHLTKIPTLANEVQYHRIRFCTCSPEYDDEETTSSEEEEDDGDPEATFFDWVSL